MSVDKFFERVAVRHIESVERGEHDWCCEYSVEERFYLCNCSKRRREQAGFTVAPSEELYFPPPDCTHCGRELNHDGDGWVCPVCPLSWSSDGYGGATFTDDNGDLSRCNEHQRKGCWHCQQATRSTA